MGDESRHKPIVVALDYADAGDALTLAARLDPALCRVKVGKELHTAAGPQVVDARKFNQRFWSDVTPFEVGAPATARSFVAAAARD